MKLIATQKFTYGNAVLKPGDEFHSSSDEDARLLKGFGKARDPDREEDRPAMRQAAMTLEADGDSAKGKGRGRYKRTDMQAED